MAAMLSIQGEIMKDKILIVAMSCATFILGIVAASYAVTSGPGGVARLSLGNFNFEIKINEVDLNGLLKRKSYDQERVKTAYGLYEIDSELINAIAKLDYDTRFSQELRGLRDRFIGPFNAPDVNVEIKFNESLEESNAQVCPDSIFYEKRVNIALSDLSNMYPVDKAGLPIIHGCPTPQGKPQPIVVSSALGKKLLKQDELPDSLLAVAKVLPNYVIVK